MENMKKNRLNILLLAGGILLTPPVRAESIRLQSIKDNLTESQRVTKINQEDYIAAKDAYNRSKAELRIAKRMLKVALKSEAAQDAQVLSTIRSQQIEGATPKFDQADGATDVSYKVPAYLEGS
jgi:hypothetical protein